MRKTVTARFLALAFGKSLVSFFKLFPLRSEAGPRLAVVVARGGASERRWDTLKRVLGLYLEAKARIWP